MRFVTQVRSLDEIQTLKELGFRDALIEVKGLSCFGDLSVMDAGAIAKACVLADIRPVLVWDRLVEESKMQEMVRLSESMDLSVFSAIRVLDPGVLQYCIEKNLNVEWIAKSGAHNLESLSGWVKAGQGKIKRLIVSSELPATALKEYARALDVELEVMGYGPILLFYTPRHLLSYQAFMDEPGGAVMDAIASCEENTHSGFRVRENETGTFLFHEKDYNLLDRMTELSDTGIQAVRVVRRFDLSLGFLNATSDLLNSYGDEKFQVWAKSSQAKWTRCFFNANSTDVLFKKLKNTRMNRKESGYLGEVVDFKKGECLILRLDGPDARLNQGDSVRLLVPTGVELELKLFFLRDLDGVDLNATSGAGYYRLPYESGVVPKTAVYRK